MHTELIVRRRAVLVVYKRFMEADLAWKEALVQMNDWFPTASRPGTTVIGNPGSPIRRLYEQRERAIGQLEVAVLKLKNAKGRMVARRRPKQHVLALLPAP